jgi:hypothetical protein
MKTVSPTSSYTIDLPDGLHEDEGDDRVFSCWDEEASELLQLSSYKRDTGAQPPSSERLSARIHGAAEAESIKIHINGCPDVAAAVTKGDDGLFWLYCYASWSDLMILATVSGPSKLKITNGWACKSIRSIKRANAT